MADWTQAFGDPDFRKLPPAEQNKFISAHAPEYASLPPAEQDKFRLAHIAANPPAPTGQYPKIDFGTNDPAARFGREAGSQILQAGEGLKAIPAVARDVYQNRNKSILPAVSRQIDNITDQAKKSASTPLGQVAAGGDILLGGDPVAAKEARARGDKAGELADLTAVPAATIGLGGILGKAAGVFKDATSTAVDADHIYAAQNIVGKNLNTDESILNKGGSMTRVTPEIRQAARDLGVKEADLGAHFPTSEKGGVNPAQRVRSMKDRAINGKPAEPADTLVAKGVQKFNDVLEKAVDTKDEQFHEILDPYKDQPFNAKATADRVRQAATQYEEWGSPQLAASLKDVASRLEGVKSIKDADGMRKVLNDLSAKIYNAPASQITDLMSADANRRAADIIRGDLYDTVADLGKIDPAEIRKIQKLHGDTIAYRDAFQNRIHGLGPAEADFQGTSPAKRILRGRSEESSVSMGKMVKRAFEPSDYGKVNAEVRKLFKGLGEGGTRDSYSPTSRGGSVEVTPSTRQKQLPPITGATVDLPGNPEVTGGVFPQREGGRRTVRTTEPFNADNPHLTAYTDHPNQPFYVTDYVGSGKGGETPAMPGTAKAIVHIDTPEAAKSALKGYDKFKNSSAYDKLDVDAKAKFDQQHQRLQAFAKQGKVGAPRNQPGPTVKATPHYGLPQLSKTPGTAPTRMRPKRGLTAIARSLPTVAVDSKYEDEDDSHR